MINNFNFTPMPKIVFGSDKLNDLSTFLNNYQSILLITGGKSFKNSDKYLSLTESLSNKNLFNVSISGEPSPDFVDEVVTNHKKDNIEAVVSIGGGSVLDFGKAVSAMLTVDDSIIHYLDDIGTKKHPGTKLPFIAIPTSSGTGSEMTKNAVLSRVGKDGFKKSLRHDNFIPDIAIIDPSLTLSCPKDMTAACGLDALTQLIESYVSTNASNLTDTLCVSGLEKFSEGFVASYKYGDNSLSAREDMSYASMLSGICLANAGLGVVHGFASSVGGYFDIPHGVVCASLLGPCTKMTIERLLENKIDNLVPLKKYSIVGELLSGKKAPNLVEGCYLLVDILYYYIDAFDIKPLSHYGVSKDDFDKIVSKTGNKDNPYSLSKEDLYKILEERL